MFFVYLGLAVADLLLLAAWFRDGFAAGGGAAAAERHQVGGLLVCVLTIFVHAVTFVYFLGTGLAVKEARRNWGIAPQHVRSTRRFKLQAYPIAMLAIALTVATGVLGGAVRSGAAPRGAHSLLAALAALATAASFVVSLRLILRNGFMLGLIRGEIAALRAAVERGAAPPDVGGGKPEMFKAPGERRRPPRGFLAGRALVFLGASAWLLFAYLRFVLRIPGASWVPFTALTVALLAAGLYLWVRHPLPADVDF